jgi:hypothetical protein
MLDDVLKIFLNYIAIPSIITTILTFVLKKYLSDKVDHYFQEKLTLFKHQLDLSTEAERFNYQRKIQDFNLYTVKKHEKYVRLYELLLESEARICGIYGFKTELTYQEHNESDVRRIMTEEKFPEGKIEEIFKIWKNRGKEDAIKEMKIFFRLIEIKRADNSFWALKNHFVISKLYLSDIIDSKFDSLLTSLGSLLANYETVEQIPFEVRRESKELIKEGGEIRKTIRPQIEELTSMLKKELSVGYYS